MACCEELLECAKLPILGNAFAAAAPLFVFSAGTWGKAVQLSMAVDTHARTVLADALSPRGEGPQEGGVRVESDCGAAQLNIKVILRSLRCAVNYCSAVTYASAHIHELIAMEGIALEYAARSRRDAVPRATPGATGGPSALRWGSGGCRFESGRPAGRHRSSGQPTSP